MGALIKLQSQTSDSELDFVGFTRFEYDFGLEGLGMGREMDIPSSECSEPLHTPLGRLQNRQDHPEKLGEAQSSQTLFIVKSLYKSFGK